MVEQQFETTKVNEAEEVFDVVLPASDQPAKIVQPSEEPFHFPTPTVAAQFPSILGLVSTLPVRGDQFDIGATSPDVLGRERRGRFYLGAWEADVCIPIRRPTTTRIVG
jgi:hypothetical protein